MSRNSAPAPGRPARPARGALSSTRLFGVSRVSGPLLYERFPTPVLPSVSLLLLWVPGGRCEIKGGESCRPQLPWCRPQVAGLGNPGLPGTRHSVGMAVLGHLARRLGVAESWARDRRCAADLALASLGDVQLVLLRPRRLMNANGRSVARAGELRAPGVGGPAGRAQRLERGFWAAQTSSLPGAC